MSAGSPASCPSRSRVVEALCILLCEKYKHPRKEKDSEGRKGIHFAVRVYVYTLILNTSYAGGGWLYQNTIL